MRIELIVVCMSLLFVVVEAVDLVLDVLQKRKRARKNAELDRKLQEKIDRKNAEFEAFKRYIENCPYPEDEVQEIEEALEECTVSFDWSNLSLMNRLTLEDIVMNVNDKLIEFGCNVDYKNIAYHNMRNPLPSFA